MKTRKPKVTNQCVDHDVSLPTVRPAPKAATCAADLTERQIFLLAETAARQHRAGLRPGDYCLTFHGFTATEDDHAHIEWVISLNTQWTDALFIARHGWEAFFGKVYGIPAPTFVPSPNRPQLESAI